MRTHGPIEQGEFLKRLGIETRAVSLMGKSSPEISATIASALKRLTEGGRGSMGSLFKVLAISDLSIPTLAGISDLPEAPSATASGKPKQRAASDGV